jgi:hypothetical protein
VEELEKLYNDAKNERDTFSWDNEKLRLQVDELQKGIVKCLSDYDALKVDYVALQDQSMSTIRAWTLIFTGIRKIFGK